eukprot:gnl/MRDRNA2_/MRDRNA2_85039_c0_seq1.p1 gnl/MRDRNA2_/MRDRNA2_85039_c0~~gnl/MRDRNA2_/MRDRNA2_85039_c0_seq1.p1  ORF type:complete len:1481 (-),score=304.83 gnl/MRDRNA2_/MRDRNA2_85039_c0_seq1:760-4701(-)
MAPAPSDGSADQRLPSLPAALGTGVAPAPPFVNSDGGFGQRPQSSHTPTISSVAASSPATNFDGSSDQKPQAPSMSPALPAASLGGSSDQRLQNLSTAKGSDVAPASPAMNSDGISDSIKPATSSVGTAPPATNLDISSDPRPESFKSSGAAPDPTAISSVGSSDQRLQSLHTAKAPASAATNSDGNLDKISQSSHMDKTSGVAAAPPSTSIMNMAPAPVSTVAPFQPLAPAPARAPSADVLDQPLRGERLEFLNQCLQNDSTNILRGIDVLNFLKTVGFRVDDPRLVKHFEMLRGCQRLNEEKAQTMLGNTLIRKALRGELAIKNFSKFVEEFQELYHAAKPNEAGHVATYIPQLANQNPNLWGVSVCSVDGQRFSIGDSSVPFCVQSTSKPVTYCVALEVNGEEKVHQHVGREPSGRNFNDRCLMQQGAGKKSIPHNPYINAGAIMTSSLAKMDSTEWDRFTYMMSVWQKLSGGVKPNFQNDTFMGERATASRNFCLAYMMEEENAFPYNTDLHKTLEAYFTWCSIEVTCESMAMVAATLANGGICPTTNERIFTYQTVTNCLSLMMSCGMYDFSGQFAFQIGFPAKSGVSGVMCVVIPGVCGLATFSPRLDTLGNSVRGIDFCHRLAKRFPYHVFCQDNKKERKQEEHTGNASLMWSAARGDEQRVRQLAARGINLNAQDYDQRSALHLAAGEGHTGTVSLLLALQADVSARDRHGNAPIDDAIRERRSSTKRTLQNAAKRKQSRGTELTKSIGNDLFRYFAPEVILNGNDIPCVARKALMESLDHCGFDVLGDPRFKFLEDFPDPFTAEDLGRFDKQHALLGYALRGQLVVPNFTRLCDKFEEMLATTIAEIKAQQPQNACEKEMLNVMTVDGQRLHLGQTDQYLCAGDLISLPLLALCIELFGQELIHGLVGMEPSGAKSDAAILNADNKPYNPFMWNGMLSLISLLEEKFGNTEQLIEEIWTKLCSIDDDQDSPVQCDEVWMHDDQQKHANRVMVLLYTSLDCEKFPDQVLPEKVMDIFFRLRAIRACTRGLGSIGAVFANSGRHPLTGDQIFEPETVKCVLSIMYAAGCNAQSGEFSFKVGIPAKSSSEGAILLVLPNVMGMCIVSPEINHNNVSLGALNFCTTFAQEFNCHVLEGDSKSSGKGDVTLYHFHTDMELCEQLLLAAESGDIVTLSALHQLGFSLDYSDYDYRTAAHVAACKNKTNVLKYLNKKGVNMHAQDRWNSTPYDDAMRSGHHKAACLLKSFMEDDDMALSDCGSVLSTMSSANFRGGFGHRTKSERATAPVAAKMGNMVTVEENDEDDDSDC